MGGESGVLEQVPVFGGVVDASARFQDGDWAGGVIAFAGAGSDAVGWFEDPIKEGLSWVIGLIMDHLQPVQDALDELVGDPGVTEAKSVELNSSADGFDTAYRVIEQALRLAAGEWQGAGAEDFQRRAEELLQTLNSLSFTYRAMGFGFQLASGIVAAVRQFVVDLIKDLLARLIKYIGEALLFPGLSWPKIAFEVARAVRDTLGDILIFTAELDDALQLGSDRIADILAKLDEIGIFLDALLVAHDQWRK